MRFAAAAILLALASVAHAEPAQQTPLEQALFRRLGAEVEAGIRANANIIDLQQQLAAAQAQVKALQENHEARQKPETDTPAAKK